MEEDITITSPSRKTVKGESLRTASKQSRSKPVEDSSKDPIKTHPRTVKGSQATKAHGKLHVQIPQSQSEASIQPHPPTDPVRRAKSSPSTGTVPPPLVTPHPLVGGPTKPPQAPTVITIAPTDHSPTTLTSKISDSSPNMAHKAGAPPLISVSTARKIPQLGSFSSVPVQPQHLDPARQRMMDRAIKARLYFLRRIGPNKFLIGGDSLESRFHVNIGPQTCSCNRVHCLHLLFVMLRVLKVKQSSPMLWAKQLRNYEAESLLGDFQTRTAQRNATPRKGSRKKFDFLRRNTDLLSGKSSSAGSAESLSSLGTSGEVETKTISPDLIEGVSSEEGESVDKGEGEGEGEEEGEEGGESDKEEDICPICLNELDEGEDLLVCPGCTNHLHQHCMDIWAMEERRKNEAVHCPVCRTLWPYNMASPSANYSLDTPPAAAGEGGVAISPRSKAGGSGSLILNQEKLDLLDRLKEMFEFSGVEGLFSSDWKTRETTLSLISREAITLLLPQITQEPSTAEGSEFRVQSVCMEVVRQSCGDSVLKVFLASLELLKVLLGYSVCHTADDALRLQEFIKPILQLLLIRCADAQHRVKDCSIEAICNLCLGQEGALSLGSACGQKTSHAATNTHYVLQVALLGQDKTNSWQWWLGRLMLMDRILNIFSVEFIISQCIKVSSQVLTPAPSFDSESDDSGHTSPCDSLTSSIAASMASNDFYGMDSEMTSMELESAERPRESDATSDVASGQSFIPASRWAMIENNLLMQMWYFAARASQVPRAKVGKLVRRVIIKVAKILRDDPLSLEVVHDVVARCHRIQAEGLLDRVLQAREGSYVPPTKQLPPQESSASSQRTKTSTNRLAVGSRRKGAGAREKGEEPRSRKSSLRNPSSNIRDRSISPSSASVSPSPGKTPPLRVTPPPIPMASSSLKDSLEKVRLRRDLSGGQDRSKHGDNGDGIGSIGNHGNRVDIRTGSGSHGDYREYGRSQSKESRRVSRQKSRNSAAGDEFVGSDESFQSAVSELDLDCSASTIMAHEEEKAELAIVGGNEGLSSGSNSHDSRRSCDSRKHNTSSSSSVEKGVESGGAVTGFPFKPGYMNFPHMYTRQTTAESAYSSDSQDLMWNPSCKNNIEEEEAAALAKVRSMVIDEVPHPPLFGLAPPTPQVLIHVQPSSKDKSHEDIDNAGDHPYIEGEHWVKGKLIGTGAFCSCFLARDMNNGTMFAVKQVSYARNTRSQEEEELSRLRDEVSMLGRITHPNIVRCLGATQHEGHINIFIEWMAGGCLDQLLHDFGYFGENVICNYTRQVTHGIVFLHENGIIHRDLKGGNILVDSTGRRLRIADFGAAARLATHTTGSGEFQNMEGTVAFMAPEVVRGGTDESAGYGRKCDVWSIGCVLLQMATAKPPWAGTYDGKNKFQLIFKIGQATAPPPMPEFANPALKDFAIRCLEVRPEDRPTSIELLKHPLFTSV